MSTREFWPNDGSVDLTFAVPNPRWLKHPKAKMSDEDLRLRALDLAITGNMHLDGDDTLVRARKFFAFLKGEEVAEYAAPPFTAESFNALVEEGMKAIDTTKAEREASAKEKARLEKRLSSKHRAARSRAVSKRRA